MLCVTSILFLSLIMTSIRSIESILLCVISNDLQSTCEMNSCRSIESCCHIPWVLHLFRSLFVFTRWSIRILGMAFLSLHFSLCFCFRRFTRLYSIIAVKQNKTRRKQRENNHEYTSRSIVIRIESISTQELYF
jgi:hypothetical protein